LKIPSEITFETTETNWVFVPMLECKRHCLRPFKSETGWQAAKHNASGKQPALVWWNSARWQWQW